MRQPVLKVSNVSKSFTMHLQNGLHMPVMNDVEFELYNSECVVLGGPSGAGKSTLLKLIYGNYAADMGEIALLVEGEYINLVTADPRQILRLRQTKIGYVSQFLSAIPRVSALNLVAEVAMHWGHSEERAKEKAAHMLDGLNIPKHLWDLPPATFSGGEQQRVNIARGFMGEHEVLLLDEPTASLDTANRAVVLSMIQDKKQTGTAMLGIFHDIETREKVADRVIDVTAFAVAA
ncbi:phosphonate C-P lyase system protein PhnL [Maritalea sp.]|uniref:phosphonate C-P lyase system protein PhnL n=1 Tax=Maritalea sp. TaxID=2003361 RepID=UPI003EF970D5